LAKGLEVVAVRVEQSGDDGDGVPVAALFLVITQTAEIDPGEDGELGIDVGRT